MEGIPMKCPACHFANPDTQKFCGQCGTQLEKTCVHCGETNPPHYRFCGECGQRLEQAGKDKLTPQGEGDRRNVTVLFSDLSGFTSLSEKLDPEVVKEVMSRIFGEVARIVASYEGFIEKYIGDAIMALFGAPTAHEDDPQRAVRAAMDINDLLHSMGPELEGMIGRPLMMHTGINTGLVVTGKVYLEEGTHGALGDTINLASRLMNLAEPGEIVIGQNTYRQVRNFFGLEKMAPVKVKGKLKEIQPYRVSGTKTKVEELKRPSDGRMTSQLVGRDAESSVLHYCLERLLAKKGSIVSITGEAGIGKSCLIEESFHYAENHDHLHQTIWLKGSTLSYGQTISYWPFIEIFSDYCGITEKDDDTAAWEKLEAKITGIFGEEAAQVLPYMASLMNLEAGARYRELTTYLDGEAMRRQIFLTVYRFFESLSRSKPLVLVFEDLHWMDESSGALLEHILPLVKKQAILIVILYRPEHETPAIRLRKVIDEKHSDSHQEIRLAPLRHSDSLDLVGNLLGTRNLPGSGWREIIGRSQGNPFFIEEVIRSLVDSGAIVQDRRRASTGLRKKWK
jgi:adenylate cyclase